MLRDKDESVLYGKSCTAVVLCRTYALCDEFEPEVADALLDVDGKEELVFDKGDPLCLADGGNEDIVE